MKRKNKNKVKVQKGDVRVGNFIFHNEAHFIKLSDINSLFNLRISKDTIPGRLLQGGMDGGKKGDEVRENYLHNYAAVMFNTLLCVPDNDFLAALNTAVLSSVDRHKDIYGYGEDVTDEEDAKILAEEKEYYEAIEGAKKEVGAE